MTFKIHVFLSIQILYHLDQGERSGTSNFITHTAHFVV